MVASGFMEKKKKKNLKLFFNSEVQRSLWKYEGSEICC